MSDATAGEINTNLKSEMAEAGGISTAYVVTMQLNLEIGGSLVPVTTFELDISVS